MEDSATKSKSESDKNESESGKEGEQAIKSTFESDQSIN